MRRECAEDEAAVLPAGYRRGWMERIGRKLKMEYVGMGSVFTVLSRTAFGDLPYPSWSAVATGGTLLLFLGIKRKTRDHLAASFLLFAAAALASPGVAGGPWFLPYALFGACIWAMEGYLEKRQTRIYALPAVLCGFAATDPAWVLALAFVAAYSLKPQPEAPRIWKRLAGILALSAIGSAVAAAVVARQGLARWPALDPPDGRLLVLYAAAAAVSGACLAVYWKRLALPHRLNLVLFGLLAPLDTRVVAMFGMVLTVALSATIFRHSIDSDRLRPLLRHAEWYFFPAALAGALWIVSPLG